MTDDRRPIRVVLAKTGVDGHDRGVKVLARGLRQEGMEVVYLGIYVSPESVARAAVEEDADVVGLSFLSGEHLTHTPKVARLLQEHGLDRVLFLVGGCIPRQHIPRLEEMGVDAVFEAGSLVPDVARYIHQEVAERRSS